MLILHSCIYASILLFLNCNQQGEYKIEKNDLQMSLVTGTMFHQLFTLQEAEQILGEQAVLADSSTVQKNDVFAYSCSFKALTDDSLPGKRGAVYVMFELYDQVPSAGQTYSSIKKANENHEGITALDKLGDEAYFHTDNQNFYFIMVRKSGNTFRMKVNKITRNTSLDNFHSVAKEIAAAL